MTEELPSLDFPGYISLKQAARLLKLSESRVYQYIQEERLPAAKMGRNIVLPLKDVEQFKPDVAGRKRKKPPSWRRLKVGGPLLTTSIQVQVREGRREHLEEKLHKIEEEDRHTLPGSVLRYVIKQATSSNDSNTISMLLVWKASELPDEATQQKALKAFEAELADVLDWSTAQYTRGEAIIHT